MKIDDVLQVIRSQLQLSRATEYELIEEIRGHLEDAVEQAEADGVDSEIALIKAAEKFGVSEVGEALQKLHAPWESAEALLTCFVPVLTAVIMRWVVYSPDGTVLGWQTVLWRPAFWVVAICMLLIPLIAFQKWWYTAISWGFFWAITLIFMTLPNISAW